MVHCYRNIFVCIKTYALANFYCVVFGVFSLGRDQGSVKFQ
jgi:hypothetical protein